MSRFFFLCLGSFVLAANSVNCGLRHFHAAASETVSGGGQTARNPPAARTNPSDGVCGLNSSVPLAKELLDFRLELSGFQAFCGRQHQNLSGFDSAQISHLHNQLHQRFKPHVWASQETYGRNLGEVQRQNPQGPFTARQNGDRVAQYQDIVFGDYQRRSLRNRAEFCSLPRISSAFAQLKEVLESPSGDSAFCQYLAKRQTESANTSAGASWLSRSSRSGRGLETNQNGATDVATANSRGPFNPQGLKLTPTKFPLGKLGLFDRIGGIFSGLWKGLSGLIKSVFGKGSSTTASDPRFPERDPNLRERVGRRQTNAGFSSPVRGAGGAAGLDLNFNTNPNPNTQIAAGASASALNAAPVVQGMPVTGDTAVAGRDSAAAAGAQSMMTSVAPTPRPARLVSPAAPEAPAAEGLAANAEAVNAAALAALGETGAAPAQSIVPRPAGEPLQFEQIFPEWVFTETRVQPAAFAGPPLSTTQRTQADWACLNENAGKRTAAIQKLRATDYQVLALLQQCKTRVPNKQSSFVNFANSYRKQLDIRRNGTLGTFTEKLISLEALSAPGALQLVVSPSNLDSLCHRLSIDPLQASVVEKAVDQLLSETAKNACPAPQVTPARKLRDI